MTKIFFSFFTVLFLAFPQQANAGMVRRSAPAPIGDKMTVSSSHEQRAPRLPRYVEVDMNRASKIKIVEGQKIRIMTDNVDDIRYWTIDAPEALNYKGIKKENYRTRKIVLSPEEVGYYRMKVEGKERKRPGKDQKTFSKRIIIEVGEKGDAKIY